MATIRIGSLELGNIPRVVAIIDNPISLEILHALKKKGIDFFEIRGDCFTLEPDAFAEYVQKIKWQLELPLLGTIKETDQNRGRRMELYSRIMPYIDAIDTDIDADDAGDLIRLGRQKTIIVSWHDFENTPQTEVLQKIVGRSKEMGADITKIATTANTTDDVVRVLEFTRESPDSIVSIVMGSLGTISRVAAPLFGSLFTFGFIGEAVAPGQLSAETMVAEMARYYPAYAREKGIAPVRRKL